MNIKHKTFIFKTRKNISINSSSIRHKIIKMMDSWLSANPNIQLLEIEKFDVIKDYVEKKVKATLIIAYVNFSFFPNSKRLPLTQIPDSISNIANQITTHPKKKLKQIIEQSQQIVKHTKQTREELKLIIKQSRQISERSKLLQEGVC